MVLGLALKNLLNLEFLHVCISLFTNYPHCILEHIPWENDYSLPGILLLVTLENATQSCLDAKQQSHKPALAIWGACPCDFQFGAQILKSLFSLSVIRQPRELFAPPFQLPENMAVILFGALPQNFQGEPCIFHVVYIKSCHPQNTCKFGENLVSHYYVTCSHTNETLIS